METNTSVQNPATCEARGVIRYLLTKCKAPFLGFAKELKLFIVMRCHEPCECLQGDGRGCWYREFEIGRTNIRDEKRSIKKSIPPDVIAKPSKNYAEPFRSKDEE